MATSHTHEAGTFSNADGKSLATFAWIPSTPPKAVIFLLHGLHSCTEFTWLSWDDPVSKTGHRRNYEHSLVKDLNDLGIAVFAHDHISHGRSEDYAGPGIRGSLRSFESMVDDTFAYINSVLEARYPTNGAPRPKVFVAGESMGGCITVLAQARDPTMFAGAVLLSPAVDTPADMFGARGRIMAFFSSVISAAAPNFEALPLQANPNANIADSFHADELTNNGQIRARMGRGFLDMYAAIAKDPLKMRIPFIALYGETDTLVNPESMDRFSKASQAQDKTIVCRQGMWHELTKEPGEEITRKIIVDWLKERI